MMRSFSAFLNCTGRTSVGFLIPLTYLRSTLGRGLGFGCWREAGLLARAGGDDYLDLTLNGVLYECDTLSISPPPSSDPVL